jgi:hypothetical protein
MGDDQWESSRVAVGDDTTSALVHRGQSSGADIEARIKMMALSVLQAEDDALREEQASAADAALRAIGDERERALAELSRVKAQLHEAEGMVEARRQAEAARRLRMDAIVRQRVIEETARLRVLEEEEEEEELYGARGNGSVRSPSQAQAQSPTRSRSHSQQSQSQSQSPSQFRSQPRSRSQSRTDSYTANPNASSATDDRADDRYAQPDPEPGPESAQETETPGDRVRSEARRVALRSKEIAMKRMQLMAERERLKMVDIECQWKLDEASRQVQAATSALAGVTVGVTVEVERGGAESDETKVTSPYVR